MKVLIFDTEGAPRKLLGGTAEQIAANLAALAEGWASRDLAGTDLASLDTLRPGLPTLAAFDAANPASPTA